MPESLVKKILQTDPARLWEWLIEARKEEQRLSEEAEVLRHAIKLRGLKEGEKLNG